MSNLLDLRPKQDPEIVIVEKIVLEKRLWYVESLKMLAVIAIASAIGWGISNADSLVATSTSLVSTKTDSSQATVIGIYGTITNIASTTLTLDDSQGSKYLGINLFTVDLTNLQDIHSNTNGNEVPITLSLANLNIGDKITARGTLGATSTGNESTLFAKTIIAFTYSTSTPIDSNLNATSTDATSTDQVATSTNEVASSTDATSTPSILDNIVNTITDFFAGTSTNSTSTEATSTAPEVDATSTEATSTDA
ncbi:MAG: hypothetical protein PHF79_03780, partial [Candidatus Pacebacteria bacterium]|nr:hypothetical protein [Candidatus Paceibacterota bacterium]